MGRIADALTAKRTELKERAKNRVESLPPVKAAKAVGGVVKGVAGIVQAVTASSTRAGGGFERIDKATTSRSGKKDPYHRDIIKVRDFCQGVLQSPNQERKGVIDGHNVEYRPNSLQLDGQPAVLLESRDERRLANFAAALLGSGMKVEEWTPPKKRRGKHFVLVDVKTGAQPERR